MDCSARIAVMVALTCAIAAAGCGAPDRGPTDAHAEVPYCIYGSPGVDSDFNCCIPPPECYDYAQCGQRCCDGAPTKDMGCNRYGGFDVIRCDQGIWRIWTTWDMPGCE